jgi:hypothetical protein
MQWRQDNHHLFDGESFPMSEVAKLAGVNDKGYGLLSLAKTIAHPAHRLDQCGIGRVFFDFSRNQRTWTSTVRVSPT